MKTPKELIDEMWDIASRINASGDKRGQELMAKLDDLEKANQKSLPISPEKK